MSRSRCQRQYRHDSTSTNIHHSPSAHPDLTKDQLEDVVVDKVAVGVLGQVEGLREVHGALLLIDQELASDEDNDALVGAGLGILGRDLVLDLLERKAAQLLDNGGGTEDGGGLKGEHRLLAVEGNQLLAVGIEGVVVKVDELVCGGLVIAR